MFGTKYVCDVCGKENLKVEEVKMLCEDCQKVEIDDLRKINKQLGDTIEVLRKQLNNK